ncbi:hypothetical protein M885DRAFT_521853 [Pelagophyceae sp. CCMP2097]|nr:hypothetical protein M885DRAFT_521853 [Pelagophyceae sp. CCMP2097]
MEDASAPYETHGGSHRVYLATKNAKLQKQLGVALGGIFAGCTVYINGHTQIRPSDELVGLVLQHGGYVVNTWGPAVTHVICERLAAAKAANFQKGKAKMVLKPTWLVDSVAARRRLPTRPYDALPAARDAPSMALFALPRRADAGRAPGPVPRAVRDDRGAYDDHADDDDRGGDDGGDAAPEAAAALERVMRALRAPDDDGGAAAPEPAPRMDDDDGGDDHGDHDDHGDIDHDGDDDDDGVRRRAAMRGMLTQRDTAPPTLSQLDRNKDDLGEELYAEMREQLDPDAARRRVEDEVDFEDGADNCAAPLGGVDASSAWDVEDDDEGEDIAAAQQATYDARVCEQLLRDAQLAQRVAMQATQDDGRDESPRHGGAAQPGAPPRHLAVFTQSDYGPPCHEVIDSWADMPADDTEPPARPARAPKRSRGALDAFDGNTASTVARRPEHDGFEESLDGVPLFKSRSCCFQSASKALLAWMHSSKDPGPDHAALVVELLAANLAQRRESTGRVCARVSSIGLEDVANFLCLVTNVADDHARWKYAAGLATDVAQHMVREAYGATLRLREADDDDAFQFQDDLDL